MKKKLASLVAVLVLVFAMVVPSFALKDGTYAVDYTLTTETGVQWELLPVNLVVKDGDTYARLVFNDTEVDKLYIGDDVYEPVDETKSGYKNDRDTYNVFEIPVKVGADTEFTLHTRGNNLVTDEYVVNVSAYDKNFDADAQAEEVATKNLGTRNYRFYKWETGKSYYVWGPFLFLAIEAVVIVVLGKTLKKD